MHPNNIYGINSRLANVYYFDAWIKKCGPRNEFFVLQRIAEVYIGNEGGWLAQCKSAVWGLANAQPQCCLGSVMVVNIPLEERISFYVLITPNKWGENA